MPHLDFPRCGRQFLVAPGAAEVIRMEHVAAESQRFFVNREAENVWRIYILYCRFKRVGVGHWNSLALLAEMLPRGLRDDLHLAFLAHCPAVYSDETLVEVEGEGPNQSKVQPKFFYTCTY